MAEDASLFSSVFEEMDLLSRHIAMLRVTREMQPIGIIRLSEVLGVPKHKVRYSLRLLEKGGLIVATSEGAMVSDRYDEFMSGLPGRFEELAERVAEMRG